MATNTPVLLHIPIETLSRRWEYQGVRRSERPFRTCRITELQRPRFPVVARPHNLTVQAFVGRSAKREKRVAPVA